MLKKASLVEDKSKQTSALDFRLIVGFCYYQKNSAKNPGYQERANTKIVVVFVGLSEILPKKVGKGR